ncbi:MAG: RHS repeat-associated core domain-containing protein [Bacteroidales bacterium]|nr:RHS repeat-associated core domain-containing protein [Bacteroidales bacterium]
MHTFSAKEKDVETGLSYFGSRYYSGDLSIWLSVDPMSDKYASLSPYVYCADNPVKLVDPNGEEIGNYYDVNGAFIGSDNIDDHTVYLVSDKKGISKGEDGNIVVNDRDFVHQLPDIESRGQILDILIGCDKKDPNSESGGCYGSMWSVEAQQYQSPKVQWGETYHYNIPCVEDEMKYLQIKPQNFIVSFDFHSHGSGECKDGDFVKYWVQSPSLKDLSYASNFLGSRTFATFGMGNQTVYFYDANGCYAKWSFEQFRSNK